MTRWPVAHPEVEQGAGEDLAPPLLEGAHVDGGAPQAHAGRVHRRPPG